MICYHLLELRDTVQGCGPADTAGAGGEEIIEEDLGPLHARVLLAQQGRLVRPQRPRHVLPHHGEVSPGGEPGVLPRHVQDPGDVLGLVDDGGAQGVVQQPQGGGETGGLGQAPSLEEATGGAGPGHWGGQQVLHSQLVGQQLQ